MCEDTTKVQWRKLSRKLKAFRDHLGLSQEGLAEELGVSMEAVRSWERCKRYPSRSSRKRMCEFFGLSEDELFPFTPK